MAINGRMYHRLHAGEEGDAPGFRRRRQVRWYFAAPAADGLPPGGGSPYAIWT